MEHFGRQRNKAYQVLASTFNVTFINKSHGDIKGRCMHYLKPDPSPANVNVQWCWISLFSKSSWIETTFSCLSYELGVNGENKVN